jgi:hypothetical protein
VTTGVVRPAAARTRNPVGEMAFKAIACVGYGVEKRLPSPVSSLQVIGNEQLVALISHCPA